MDIDKKTIDAFCETQINVLSTRYEPRPLTDYERRKFAEAEADRLAAEEIMNHNFELGKPLPESVRAACCKVHDNYMRSQGF